MKLRFNKGAIVELSLFGNATPKIITGKVIDVLEDEVIICPQKRVPMRGKLVINPLVSADADYFLHVNRQLISGWRYVKVLDLNSNGTVEEDMAVSLNHYDPNTFYCEGDGQYCGDIVEKYSSSIIISM